MPSLKLTQSLYLLFFLLRCKNRTSLRGGINLKTFKDFTTYPFIPYPLPLLNVSIPIEEAKQGKLGATFYRSSTVSIPIEEAKLE